MATDESGEIAARLLRRAAEITAGNRDHTHGHKERSFTGIANIWTVYLREKAKGQYDTPMITALDVAHMMVLMKMIRALYGKKVEDHWIDMAGYAGIGGEIVLTEREQEPIIY